MSAAAQLVYVALIETELRGAKAGMEGALNFPHVVILLSRERAIDETDLLWELVRGVDGADLQLTYCPSDGTFVAMLMGVCDRNWPKS